VRRLKPKGCDGFDYQWLGVPRPPPGGGLPNDYQNPFRLVHSCSLRFPVASCANIGAIPFPVTTYA
jgi:hypothetical protein